MNPSFILNYYQNCLRKIMLPTLRVIMRVDENEQRKRSAESLIRRTTQLPHKRSSLPQISLARSLFWDIPSSRSLPSPPLPARNARLPYRPYLCSWLSRSIFPPPKPLTCTPPNMLIAQFSDCSLGLKTAVWNKPSRCAT
jgi:hypothetical protein